MKTFRVNRASIIGAALLAAVSIAGCDKAVNPKTADVPTDQTAQSTTPPPAGDSEDCLYLNVFAPSQKVPKNIHERSEL